MSPLSQSGISEGESEHLDQVFFINFKSLKTVGEAGEVLDKSLNFTHTCLYEPCKKVELDSLQSNVQGVTYILIWVFCHI